MTPADKVDVALRKLDLDDDLRGFSCGAVDLDDWLREDAARLQSVGTVAVYLARTAGELVGYVSLLADSIRVNSSELKRLELEHNDHPSVAAVKIAHLAVRTGLQGKGIGTAMLRFAFDQAVLISAHVGCRLLTLDAYPGKVSWYERKGFVRNKRVAKEAASAWACPAGCPEYREDDGRPRVSMRLDVGGEDADLLDWMKD